MAALPRELTRVDITPRHSSEKPLSHGRGGAGNIGTSDADLEKPSLETPRLRGDVYTTGRGGSGNMAKNDDPELARLAQDVEINPRKESMNAAHVGRGGAANVFVPSQEDIAAAKASSNWSAVVGSEDGSSFRGEVERKPHPIGLADKGKEWLFNLARKKTNKDEKN